MPRRRNWRWIVRTFGNPRNRWGFTADGVNLFNSAKVPIQRYHYRGNTIPHPVVRATSPDHHLRTKDVTLAEDAGQVRRRHAPAVPS
ncbi:hypothetical protein ACGH7X_05180 [Streptomyces sp. BBFR51]|uniref:hypothetical protein n=1 Tax=Streptomyces sp. BBFR51 TaxID=3372856 RepID=UPI0037DDB6CB